MPEWTRLDLPATTADLASLVTGEEVRLYGTAYTARDATHVRLLEEARATGGLPHGLAGQTIFYAGPTPPAAGRPAGSIGPTTASRMDPWTPELLSLGVTVTIGKGRRDESVAAACRHTGAVYLAAVGGSAALLATHVTDLDPVAYEDLGTEALRRVRFDGFPAFVAIDAAGRDAFAQAREEWRIEERMEDRTS